jgi:phytanoyl-CoA hydroxylase
MSEKHLEPSAQLIESYLTRGYLAIPDVLSPEEIREIERDLWKLSTGGYACPGIKPLAASLTEEQVKQRILGIHEAHLVSPVIEKYVCHPAIVAILAKIVGGHLRHWDGAVKCVQSMYYSKPPGMAGHPWHQDEAYFPTRDRSLTAVYIAIDTISVDNGCLWFIPGSHRDGYLFPRRPHNESSEYLFEMQSSSFSTQDMVPMEMRPGSVAFFNGYLLHRSTRNGSQQFRRVLVNHYCNSWSVLPRYIPPDTERERMGEEIGLADDRKVWNVSGADPYAWKGYDHSDSHVYILRMRADL